MQYLKSHAIIGSLKKNLQFPNEHLEMGTSWNWSKVLLILFGLLNEPEINYLPLFSQALDYWAGPTWSTTKEEKKKKTSSY